MKRTMQTGKKSLIIVLIAAFAFSVMGIFDFIPVKPVKAVGTTYYVSTSGDDNNNGTSEQTPWRTLAKVSSMTFSPGDQILLKRGDTWTGETLKLRNNGGSRFNWTVLSAYGTGDRPKIYPGANSPESVTVENNDLEIRNCGWKIIGIEVGYAKQGIYWKDRRTGCEIEDQLDGFWVEDCYIHHMTGLDEEGGWSNGIHTSCINSWVNYVTFRNNIIEYVDCGSFITRVNYLHIDNCELNYCGYFGFKTCMLINGTIDDCDIMHIGILGRAT
ncbi:MAG TPA: hypothetical protein PLZ84_04760, partial [Clostridia bacterium]|nr:hypothetical protein [Clostridia bacterium]